MSHENITTLALAYDGNEIFYWSSSAGDLFVPGQDGKARDAENPGELPMKIRNLYDNYWSEDVGCCMQVASYKDQPGMILNYLFDKGFCRELSEYDDADDDMDRLYDAVKDAASIIERDNVSMFCKSYTVFCGYKTDPAGHEIVVFIPYEHRSKLNEVASDLECTIYTLVKELF